MTAVENNPNSLYGLIEMDEQKFVHVFSIMNSKNSPVSTFAQYPVVFNKFLNSSEHWLARRSKISNSKGIMDFFCNHPGSMAIFGSNPACSISHLEDMEEQRFVHVFSIMNSGTIASNFDPALFNSLLELDEQKLSKLSKIVNNEDFMTIVHDSKHNSKECIKRSFTRLFQIVDNEHIMASVEKNNSLDYKALHNLIMDDKSFNGATNSLSRERLQRVQWYDRVVNSPDPLGSRGR